MAYSLVEEEKFLFMELFQLVTMKNYRINISPFCNSLMANGSKQWLLVTVNIRKRENQTWESIYESTQPCLLSSLYNTNLKKTKKKLNLNLIKPLYQKPIYDIFKVQRNMFTAAKVYNSNSHWKSFARKVL